MVRRVRFGVIGCGLMGREFASAAARWCHLKGDIPAPEIVAVCDTAPAAREWFTGHFTTVRQSVSDYRELLQNADVEAVYVAVPHHLQQQVYIDVLQAGKHLMGEKPFGIDFEANRAILEEAERHPGLLVRCSSEFPFYPACRALYRWIESSESGRILEVRSGFNHSSDMDPEKPINWKRKCAFNGKYGCMGDLGIHTQHIPFRAGWLPQNVCGKLSKFIDKRPDGRGGTEDCDTFDNATLVCDATDRDGNLFPIFFETKRMCPGATNDWFIEVYGMRQSARFSTGDPGAFCFTQAMGKKQAWARVVVGYEPQFPTVTGDIFEFGFTDAILQMWAAYLSELDGRAVEFGCFTPEETRLSHTLLTGALRSHESGQIVPLSYGR